MSACGARTRSGGACRTPPVTGKRRCRMHGGNNPGAPKGSANGNWKGGRSLEAERLAASMREARQARRFIEGLLAELEPKPIRRSGPVECFVCERSFEPSKGQRENRNAGQTRFRCAQCTPLQMAIKLREGEMNGQVN